MIEGQILLNVYNTPLHYIVGLGVLHIRLFDPKKESQEGIVSWKKGLASLFLIILCYYFLDKWSKKIERIVRLRTKYQLAIHL